MSIILTDAERLRSRSAQRKQLKQTETKQQRELRLAQARATRKQLREKFAADDDAILGFKQWCALNDLSERQGRRILAEPGGPVVTKLSDKKIGISRRHNREWQEARTLP
jgi:hypothetical protein